MSNFVFNPESDFPLRYFDLTNTCDIANARLGEKVTILADVLEVQKKRVFSHDDAIQVTAADSTGIIELNLLNNNFYKKSFDKGQRIVFSGIIETYDSEKCINNPLVKVIEDESNKEVVAVYPFDYVPKISDFNRPEYKRTLYGNEGMALKEALLGLHGFLDKQKLIEARHTLKFDELVTCHLACLEAGTTLEKELLMPFRIEDVKETSCETRLICRQAEGEEAQAIKDTIGVRNKICIVCPLAYATSEIRNAMVWEFDQSSKVPSVKSHPNISIEVSADCPKSYDALKKRKSQICKLCNIRDSKNARAISNVDFNIQFDKNDLLVIEDADRISTLQIDFWRRMAGCRTLIVSNSKSQLQQQRLSFLCDTHTQEEILYHEMSYRRDGDILGCRNDKFKCLKLINFERDKQMSKKAEAYAKELIRA